MLLVLIGFCLGTLGTLIGVGGGFILVPLLLLLFPKADNVWITSVSMWVVAMNATSGSINYYFKGRVHLRSALAFTLACVPGSILGVALEPLMGRATFTFVFGLAMIGFALILLFRKQSVEVEDAIHARSQLPLKFYVRGCFISFFVGFVASFLGIGGGVIHVPLLSHVLDFPVHMATGTSHMILACTAWFTTAVHLYREDIRLGDPVLWQLGLSAVVGAQLGAQLSVRVSGQIIIRVLAIALILVGLRLIWPTVVHLLG